MYVKIACKERLEASLTRHGSSLCFLDWQSSLRGSEYKEQSSLQNVILGALPFGSMLDTFREKVCIRPRVYSPGI